MGVASHHRKMGPCAGAIDPIQYAPKTGAVRFDSPAAVVLSSPDYATVPLAASTTATQTSRCPLRQHRPGSGLPLAVQAAVAGSGQRPAAGIGARVLDEDESPATEGPRAGLGAYATERPSGDDSVSRADCYPHGAPAGIRKRQEPRRFLWSRLAPPPPALQALLDAVANGRPLHLPLRI
jgi:hypothetical protein